MDPVKLGEIRKKRKAELRAELNELKAAMKEFEEKGPLPGPKLINEKRAKFLMEVSKKQKAALREEYRNRKPLVLRLNSRAASPPGVVMLPAFSEDGEGKEA